MIKYPLLLLLAVLFGHAQAQKITHSLLSPDKAISVTINSGEKVSYEVNYKGKKILLPSEISMQIYDGKVLGEGSRVVKTSQRSVNENVRPLYGMATVYKNEFNELTLRFGNDYGLIFRVYNYGVAYRFVTSLPGRIKIKNEGINYKFDTDITAWVQPKKTALFGYEELFSNQPISSINGSVTASLPLVAESNGVRIGITEADLLDYPGYFLQYNGNNTLHNVTPKVVLKDSVGGQNNYNRVPYGFADYLAETEGTRSFPWRLMIVAEADKDLLYNNLVYLLASDSKIGDPSWIKPGKVSWDWWNANNLTGVDFKAGLNTETYKYYIDFAARNGMRYVIMDEGWGDEFDLLKITGKSFLAENTLDITGDLDLPYLANYANAKGVGIVLWCVWHTLDRQMTAALDQFQKWGIKGVKVDFMNRDDQTVVNFYQRLAGEAAKRKLVVDFHAAYKPTGLERTYPNILNYEAVQGLEWGKFSSVDILPQTTVLPFTRMLAGPMDYTPGGLYNASREDFKMNFYRPMTHGTRCNQLAMFTMYYAPFEMLADAPTAYEKEPAILQYLKGMPTTWDETIPLHGKIGDHAVIARRSGTTWHVGGLNNWTAKTVKLSLDFLGAGAYTATLFKDGVNAARIGDDYKKVVTTVTKASALEVAMASGGGFAIKLERR